MDGYRVDALARALASTSTRRALLGTLLGLPLLLVTRRAGAAPPPCAQGLVRCNGVCVDLNIDEQNCGACDNVCLPMRVCKSGVCVLDIVACIAPRVVCNGVCVDLQTDVANCGMCGNACVSGATCLNGNCWVEAITCAPGLTDCNGDCVDLSSSFGNCGACGNACEGVQDAYCCNGVCTRLTVDPYNCGGCGNVCTANATCIQSDGSDGPPHGICVCLDGYTACNEGCFDLGSDPSNCGGCFVACPAGQACVNGACTGGSTPEPTPTGTPEPTKTPEPTPTETPADQAWDFWTGTKPQHGAVIYQRQPAPGDDPIAMGGGATGPAYIRADFARLAALGATYAVLSVPLPVKETDPEATDTALLNRIDDLIAATDAGLGAVVAPRTGPGRSDATLGAHVACTAGGCLTESGGAGEAAALWTDAAARAGWVAGWTALARHLRGNEHVVGYELLSLPNPPSRTAWKRLADALIEAIRTVDDQTPILLHAPGDPAKALANRLTRDPRTVHLLDWFAPERFVTQAVDAAEPLTYPGRLDAAKDGQNSHFDRAWLEEQLAPVTEFVARYGKPVAIGAFGLPRWQPGAADYLADELAVFEELGLASALWLWYPAVWPGEADAFDVTRGPDPVNHDAVENDLLAAVRSAWT